MDPVTRIYNVLSGNASPAEKKELDEWIASSDENNAEFQDVKLLWESGRDIKGQFDQHFHDGLRKVRDTINIRKSKRKKSRILGITLTVASILLIVYLIFNFTTKEQPPKLFLKFDDAPLVEVVETLEKNYHVDIAVGKEIRDCRFTGTFAGTSVEEMVRAVAEGGDLEYTVIDEGTFGITGTGCKE